MTSSKHIFVRLAVAAVLLLIAGTGDFIATSVLDGVHGECNPLVRIEHKCDTTSGSRLAVVHHLTIPQQRNTPTLVTPLLNTLLQAAPVDLRLVGVVSLETETPLPPLLISSSLRC
jgi:hypothetical protein